MKQRFGALVALVAVALAAVPYASTVHFALSRSVPAADSTGPAPVDLTLWFTQVPKPGSLSVRLVDAQGSLVTTEEPQADQSDAKVIHMPIGHRLSAGAYTVAWRGIGDDGHVVQSEFAFTVAAE